MCDWVLDDVAPEAKVWGAGVGVEPFGPCERVDDVCPLEMICLASCARSSVEGC
jgi:hypothetical protein